MKHHIIDPDESLFSFLLVNCPESRQSVLVPYLDYFSKSPQYDESRLQSQIKPCLDTSIDDSMAEVTVLVSLAYLFQEQDRDPLRQKFAWTQFLEDPNHVEWLSKEPGFRDLAREQYFRDSWSKLPLEYRVKLHKTVLYEPISLHRFDLEDLGSAVITMIRQPDDWDIFTVYGKDFFVLFLQSRDSTMAEELEGKSWPLYAPGSTVHWLFVRSVKEHSQSLLAEVYAGVPTRVVLEDMARCWPNELILQTNDNADLRKTYRICQSFFKEQFEKLATPDDHLFMVNLLLYERPNWLGSFCDLAQNAGNMVSLVFSNEHVLEYLETRLLDKQRPPPINWLVKSAISDLFNYKNAEVQPEIIWVLLRLYFLMHEPNERAAWTQGIFSQPDLWTMVLSATPLDILFGFTEPEWQEVWLQHLVQYDPRTEDVLLQESPADFMLAKVSKHDIAGSSNLPKLDRLILFSNPLLPSIYNLLSTQSAVEKLKKKNPKQLTQTDSLLVLLALAKGDKAVMTALEKKLGEGESAFMPRVVKLCYGEAKKRSGWSETDYLAFLATHGLFEKAVLPGLLKNILDRALFFEARYNKWRSIIHKYPQYEVFYADLSETKQAFERLKDNQTWGLFLDSLFGRMRTCLAAENSPGSLDSCLGLKMCAELLVSRYVKLDVPGDIVEAAYACARNALDLVRNEAKIAEGNPMPVFLLNSIQSAIVILTHNGEYWKTLHQLILAFRHLTLPTLKPDLSIDRHKDSQSNPWTEIPIGIEKILNHKWDDPAGLALRRSMTRVFLDYLKPRKPDQLKLACAPTGTTESDEYAPSMIEPDALWRYAYLRAVGDLGINTDGKGHQFHRILDKVAQNDPSKLVREMASKIAEKINTREGIVEGSHKRLLMQAWWWIRQVHALRNGIQIDESAALLLRQTEVRR